MDGINRKFGEMPSVDDFDCGDGTLAAGDCKFEVFVSTIAGSTTVTIGSSAGSGTVSSSGIALSGTGTAFLTEARTGKAITVGPDTRIIAAVLSDSALLVEAAFSTDFAGQPYTISQTSFKPTDTGKIIGIFGAGASGVVVPIFVQPLVLSPTTDEWQAMFGYDGVTPVALDTLGAISAKFTVSSRFGGIEWELFGSNSSDFTPETSVDGPTVVEIADGEVGSRDLFTDETLTFRYYRAKARRTSSETTQSFGALACYGYLHYSTIASVIDPVTATMADAASVTLATAQAYWGKHEDRAINNGLQAVKTVVRGMDSVGKLGLPGSYLVSLPTIIPNKVTLAGNGLGSAIVADPGVFPADSPVVQLGEIPGAGAYSCRLESAYVYCNETPGSIGVYSEQAQERSGLFDVDIQRFGKKGIWFKGFGCQHFTIERTGSGPGGQTIGDDEAVGIHLEQVISANVLSRITTFGNHSISGYGTGIKLSNGAQCSLRDIHTESSHDGIYITEGSIARIYTHTPGPGVIRGIRVSADSTVYAIDGGTSLIDEGSSKKWASFLQGQNLIGNEVHRFIGRSAQGGDIAYFENNGQNVRINKLGRLDVDAGSRRAPNILVLGAGPNFGGPNQGGWIGVNSQASAFPDWIQTSDKLLCTASASTNKLTLDGDWPTLGNSRLDYLGEHWDWTLADDDQLYVVGTDGESADLAGGLSFGQVYFVVNADSSAKTFSLSLTEGGAAVDISSDAAEMYVTMCPYAGFYRIGATWFEFRTGNATNEEGADPGEMIFQCRSDFGVRSKRFFFYRGDNHEQNWGNPFGLHRARWAHGETDQAELIIERSTDSGETWEDGWVFHLSDGGFFPRGGVYPSNQRFAGDFAGEGSPEGALSAFKGSTYRDRTNGRFYVKQTGSGSTNTGWVDVSDVLWSIIDSDTIGTPYQVEIDDQTDSRAVGISVTPTSHVSQAATPLYQGGGWEINYQGRETVKSIGVGATAPASDGDATINGVVTLSARTASRPLKTDGSKRITDGKIDLGVANDIAGTGLSDTQILYWDAGTGTVKSKALAMSDITGLVSALAGKSDVGHSHTMDSQGAHTHGSAVPSDGGHTHTIS